MRYSLPANRPCPATPSPATDKLFKPVSLATCRPEFITQRA
ncbi:hypothetical protein BN2364_4075 [Alloalcanivorax xenomutans]|nr:hypothetical protein BN2364_4075 [Alloalcanivorax xenomutans]